MKIHLDYSQPSKSFLNLFLLVLAFAQSIITSFLNLFLLILADPEYGFGSMGPIFGDYGLFCTIDASGKQAVICWDTDNSSSTASSSSHYSTILPPIAALFVGEGFLCGILADSSQALCWDSMGYSKSSDLVPKLFNLNAILISLLAHPAGAINVQIYRLIMVWTAWDIARRAAFTFFGIFSGTEENPEFLQSHSLQLIAGPQWL